MSGRGKGVAKGTESIKSETQSMGESTGSTTSETDKNKVCWSVNAVLQTSCLFVWCVEV